MLLKSLVLAVTLVVSSGNACLAATGFEGTWLIMAADKAPWEDPANPIINDGSAGYIGKTVTIGNESIDGPPLLDCGKTTLIVAESPFAGLFEGGLGTNPKDPAGPYDEAKANRVAKELGFTAEPVATLNLGCSELLLHLRDPDTIMFGLDNRIYTLKKQ